MSVMKRMHWAAATAVSGAALFAFASGAHALSEVEEERIQVSLEPVAEGLAAPVDLRAAPDGRLFIVEQVGRVRIVENGELLDEPFLDISDRIVEQLEEFDERGLLAIAFHPDYTDNGRFFVYYSAPIRADAPFGRRARWDHTAYLSEFRVSEDDPNRADPDSERQILEVDQPAFNHNGAQILFGPDDGYLYIGLGDGGAAHDLAPDSPPEGYGQHRETLLGKILRIDVDNDDDETYAIPEDNPFVDEEPWEPEIYALGFRNPWRMSFDGQGRLLVADVGQWAFEWMHIVEAGGNYGWRIKEGSHCFDPHAPTEHPDECPDENWGIPLTDPVVEYQNRGVFPDEGLGVAIMGGHMYEGSDVPDLEGMYVYADWSREFWEADGVLMAAREVNEGFWPIHFLEVTNLDEPLPYILSIGRDADGELYVLTSPSTGPLDEDGTVYRIAPAN
jgi:glucose/arabinose dehydrogenase